MTLDEALNWISAYKSGQPTAGKEAIQSAFARASGAPKRRSVFACDSYTMRFSEANKPSFSNGVLSLSALQQYDHLPMVICIVRPTSVDFRLANTTFLKRISHSSRDLRTDHIRGTFLGHDILDNYEGRPNRPSHFAELFAIHGEFTWEENVERLVEATNSIVPRDNRFQATEAQTQVLLAAPARAAELLQTSTWRDVENELSLKATKYRQHLLQYSQIDNVNIRGNRIEQLITGHANAHDLGDLVFPFPVCNTLVVDIKTKLLRRASAPKAYNIDKFLRFLSQEGRFFAFFFIGLDAPGDRLITRLTSAVDPAVLSATRIQHHWAGRSSRGVTQLVGDLGAVFLPDYRSSIDIQRSKAWLRQLIER